MPEHKSQDKTGRIFKQVLAVANEKLLDIAGLELVCETDAGAADEDDGDAAGASQSQAAAASQSQATAGRASSGGGSGGPRYMLVNRLPEVVTVPIGEVDEGYAIYLAFVEVVLAIITETQDSGDREPTWVTEDVLFGHLKSLGLERDSKLPAPADTDKVEQLVQKRLVSEAFLRRKKQRDHSDAYEYLVGARAILHRNQDKAGMFLDDLKKK